MALDPLVSEFQHDAQRWEARALAAEARERKLRAALAMTVELCNVMRDYVPTLSLEADRALRDALALAGGSDRRQTDSAPESSKRPQEGS